MTNKVDSFIEESKRLTDNAFQSHFEHCEIPEQLKNSMLYSLLAGGKRLRPVLLFASYSSFTNNSISKTKKTAMALEMIHTYSLIHDDLPAMDDDDLRRGVATNHKKFDEATAILAGDALLTNSFELISEDEHLSDKEKVYVIQSLAKSSGPAGMVAGQILDMEGEGKTLNIQDLEKIHEYKTGQLITFAILTGAYLAGVSKNTLEHLKQFAYYLGLIFQVQDDILDLVGDPEKLGKPVGSDQENDKSTYPGLLGLDGAINQKKHYIKSAEQALDASKANGTLLSELLYYFGQRDH